MAKIWAALGGLLVLVCSSVAQAREPIMLELDYTLRAYRNNHTGLYRVYDAPVRTSKVRVITVGKYCYLTIRGIEYTRFNGDYAWPAYPRTDGTWAIPAGVVRAIDVHFTQNHYSNVDCTLKVYDAN
jgi:hypothetical protein